MPPGLSFPVTPPSYPLPSSHSFIPSQSTEGLLCVGHQASLGRPACRADSQPPSSLHSTPHLTLPTLLFLFPPSIDSPTLRAHLLPAPTLGAPASTWTTDGGRLLSSAVLVWGNGLGWPPELCLERGPAVTSGFWGHDRRHGRAIATAGLLAQNTLCRSPHLHQHVHTQAVHTCTHMYIHTCILTHSHGAHAHIYRCTNMHTQYMCTHKHMWPMGSPAHRQVSTKVHKFCHVLDKRGRKFSCPF